MAIFLCQHSRLAALGFFETIPLQAAGFALLAIKPLKPLPAGRFLWPAPAIVWLLYQLTLLGQLSGVGKTTPVLAAILVLPWAPSLALGTAITWALTALYYLNLYQIAPRDPHFLLEAIELLICVPLALIVTTIARTAATRAEPRNR